jgi:hypothetical protein
MTWYAVPGGMRRAGSTHERGVCMQDGERMPHSHYVWARDAFWAAFGEFTIRQSISVRGGQTPPVSEA